MPALVAARFNADLKAKYRQLITAGKPAKVAFTAIMPKLVVTANALLKADRLWVRSPPDHHGYSRTASALSLLDIFHVAQNQDGRLPGMLVPNHSAETTAKGRVSMTRITLLRMLILASAAMPSQLFAQSTTSPEVAEEDPVTGDRSVFAQDIIVTANRREQNVQDVGLSVSAFDGELLEALNVESAGKLAQLAPNVEFKKQWGSRGNSSLFYIRGIGQADFNEGSESPTTVYVDDFYVLSNSATDFLVHDVQSAEVLRGPQGTLFGRNSTAGAVLIHNNVPAHRVEGHAALSVGNHNHTELTGMLNLPIVSDKLAVRFSVNRDKHDPTTKNLFEGPGPGGHDILEGNFLSARGMARWDPTERFTVNYKYQYGWVHARNGGDSSQPMMQIPGDTIIVDADGFGYNPTASGANSRRVIAEGVNDFSNKVHHHLLTAEYELSDRVTLRSITGYLKQFKDTLEDCDGTPRTICHAYNIVKQDYWTQEARLSIDLENVKLTFGAYYLNLDYFNTWVLPILSGTGTFQGHPSIQPGDTPGGLVQITPNTSQLEAYSGYGNIAFDVTDAITLHGGVRLNHEGRDFQQTEGLYFHNAPDTGVVDFQGNRFGIVAFDRQGYASFLANNVLGVVDPVGDPEVNFVGRFKSNFITYQISADFRPADDVLLYVSHKLGVKAGGFNNGLTNFSASQLEAIPFKNEKNFAYETGLKWSTGDSRLRINPSLFYYDYKDYQATAFSLTNASLGVQVLNRDATAYGGEVEVFANIANGLDVFVGAGYVKTKVQDITKVGAGVIETKDRELGQAPRWQSSGMIRYETDLLGGEISNQVAYSYLGRRYVDVFNDTSTRLPAHLNVDYSVTYEPGGERNWYVSGYVKNVFDKTSPTQKFNFASLFQTGQINYFPPRFYGVEIGLKW